MMGGDDAEVVTAVAVPGGRIIGTVLPDATDALSAGPRRGDTGNGIRDGLVVRADDGGFFNVYVRLRLFSSDG